MEFMRNSKLSNDYSAINNSLLICGCGRSGTSILSLLIATFQSIEYSFDSPLLHWLLSKVDIMPPDCIVDLINVYLGREVLWNSLNGRNLNLKKDDLSSAYKYINSDEINFRINVNQSSEDLKKSLDSYRICFKVTDAIYKVGSICELFPGLSVVAIARNAFDTIASIYEKRWFSDAFLATQGYYSTLSNRYGVNGKILPHWLLDSEINLWETSSLADRSALYYIKMTSSLLLNLDKLDVVNYDYFVNNPYDVAADLKGKYDFKDGSLSQHVLSRVRPRKNRLSQSFDADMISPKLLGEVQNLNSQISKIAISLNSN